MNSEPLIAAAWAALTGTLVVTVALAYLHVSRGARRFTANAWWAAAFACWAGSLAANLALSKGGGAWLGPADEFLHHTFPVFVLAGTWAIIGRTVRLRWVVAGVVLLAVWIFGGYGVVPHQWLDIPAGLLSGVLLLLSAGLFWRKLPPRFGSNGKVQGVLIAVWGLHAFSDAFQHFVTIDPELEFWFTYLLSLVTAVLLIILTLRHEQALIRRAKHRALDQEHLLATVLDSIPHSIYIKDLEGRYRMVNDAGARFWDRPKEELLGRTLAELPFVPPEGRQVFQATDDALLASGIPQESTQVTLQSPTGESLVLWHRKYPLRDGSGAVTGIISWSEDITAQKRAEQALTKSEERYRTLFEQAGDGIFVADAQGALVDVNPSGCVIVGYSKEELIGRTVRHLLDPDELRRDPVNLAPVKAGDLIVRQRTLRHKDGGRVLVELAVSRLPDGGHQTIVRDLTARKQSEDRLRENQQLLRAVVDSVGQSIAVKGLDGRYLLANRVTGDNQGLTPEQIVGRTSAELPRIPPELLPRILAYDQEVLETGHPSPPIEAVYVQPDGSLRVDRSVKYPLRDPEGRIVGVVTVGDDITARKQAEERLRESENLLQTVLDTVRHAIFVKDLNGRFILVNQAMAGNNGMTRELMLGGTLKELAGLDDAARAVLGGMDRTVIETGEPVLDVEGVFQHRSGWNRIERLSKFPLKDPAGRTVGVVGIAEDITERKRADEQLRESQSLLQTVLDTVSHTIYVKDQRLGYRLVNRAMAASHNLTPQEMVGRKAAQLPLLNPESLRQIETTDRLVLETGQATAPVEIAFTEASGRARVERLVKFPLKDVQGRVVGVIGVAEDITERKRGEERLRQSQSLLQTVMDTVEHAIFVKDLDGRYLLANKAMADLYALTPAAMQGLTSLQLPSMTSEEQDLLLRMDDAVKRTGEPARVAEVNLTQADGRVTVHQVTKYPLKDAEGTLMGIIGGSQDITGRKRTEETVQAARLLLQTVMDTVPHGIVLKDAAGRYQLVNRHFAAFHGLTPQDIVGKRTEDIPTYRQVERSAVAEAERRVLDGTSPAEAFEADLVNRRGEREVHHVTKLPVRDANGRITAVVTFAQDITARKLAEEELSRMAAAVEHAGDSVMITDTDGVIQYVNPAFERITGYSRQEAVGRKPSLLKSGRHGLEFYAELWNTLKRGQVWKARYTNRRKDGRLYEAESTNSVVHDAAGRATHFVAVQRDVSQQVQLEEQLRRSQRMEALGTLAGGIAHDFNNILAPILGYAELILLETALDSQQAEKLRVILDAGRRARDLVSQIMLFSRRPEGKRQVIGVEPLVNEVLALLKSTSPKNVALEFQAEPAVAPVEADPTQIHQVVMNLCVNAVQAMPEGGRLSVALEGVSLHEQKCFMGGVLSGEFACISVTDTGSGMTDAVMAHIFEPFYTTKAIGKGTGLGLSTVFGIVESHGGGVDVRSQPFRGSTFRVYLPIAAAGAPSPAAGAESPSEGRGERILCVDDEPMIVELMRATLQSLGYTADIFTESNSALAAFREHPARYCLVITDLTMPELPGDRFAEAIQTVLPGLPVLLYSGLGDTLTEEKLKRGGIRAVLQKPVNRHGLALAVRQALDAAGGGAVRAAEIPAPRSALRDS
jgi:PAS domain S-box-containing protein